MPRTSPILLVTALLTASWFLPAGAFQAPRQRIEHIAEGTEWAAAQRLMAPHSYRRSAPETFRQRHGDGWTQRLHGPNGTFHSLMGEGVPVGTVVDESSALAVAERFWADNHDLLPADVALADLEPWSAVEHDGTWYVSHRQTVHGVDVLHASTFVAIRQGRVPWLAVRLFPGVQVDAEPRIAAGDAVDTAVAGLADLGAEGLPGEARLAIFPRTFPDRFDYNLVWAVELKGPVTGRWTAYVDAHEGVILALADERSFLDATVNIEHHDRHPGNSVVASPMRYASITHDDGSDHTGADGSFWLDDTDTDLDVSISGTYVRVDNLQGSEISTSFSDVGDGDAVTWGWEDTEDEQAQQDGYRFINDVRDWAHAIAPDVQISSERINLNVNYNDNCNAWYDGDITTLQAGNGCNNTAMVADTLYHEYGHGFHWYSIIWGVGDWSGDVGEGLADAMAFLQTGDSVMSPYFMTSGSGIRDVEPDQVYPDDVVGEVHYDGLIVGGAVWDLRTLLIADLGEEEGQAVVEQIFAGMAKTSSDLPSTYEAALDADDDNGNLDDGTPHVCQIDSAFGLHGLVGSGMGALTIEHDPVVAVPSMDEPLEIQATIRPAHPECLSSSVGDVRLVWSTDGGHSWESTVMDSVSDDLFAAELPAVEDGTQIRYRIEADETETGTVLQRPINPADAGYYLYVGELSAIFCLDFEEDDQDWSHELLEGQASEGADDWMVGTPGGNGGDPDHAWSGDYAWGNDLSLEDNWDGMYQNDKINTLYSPVWNLAEHDTVRLQFRRWLGVEDSVYDQGRIYVNDEVVWVNADGPGDLQHVDYEWILFDLDITEQAGGQDEVQIRWEIESDGGLQFGGWTIDDVCLYEMVEGSAGDDDDATDVDDDDAEGEDDVDGLSITGGDCTCRADASTSAPAAALGLLAGLALIRRRA